MTDLRTIVAQMVSGAPFPSKRSQNKAIDILDAIEAAGFRILGPDEVDQVTLEKAATLADLAQAQREQLYSENGASINAHKAAQAEEIASAIRILGRKA